MSCASSVRITKLKQSIFAPFDIYGYDWQLIGALHYISIALHQGENIDACG